MNRNIVYPGSIPLDSDLLSINRNTLIALGHLIRATLGTEIVIDGFKCSPTVPPSLSVLLDTGSLVQMSVLDVTPYGSLPADELASLMKMGINNQPQSFTLQPPVSSGQSVDYLIQARLQESDEGLSVLSYYNASNPSQPYSGPQNSGLPQATLRRQSVQLQLKSGIPSTTGTQLPPAADQGSTGLYVISVFHGQTSISLDSISVVPTAPFINWKLPNLQPGFGAGVMSFSNSGTFVVPPGVSQVEVELWGGGAGSFASTASSPSGGGSGGGYARKRVCGLLPGQSINVMVGVGGSAGRLTGQTPGAGGTSSFGTFVSATGGSLNYLANLSSPQFGATPPGVGINGDVNFTGSAGQAAILNQGGMGGGAPMNGGQNSGTTGVAGTTPGGGAAGAGTGANSSTQYDGAAGGAGLIVVRW